MNKFYKPIFIIGIFLCLIGFASIVYADSIANRMAGKILLQVEENGEAWYVNPVNKQRYFLGRPNDAFELMRKLGLGISNENLNQIPIAKDSPSIPTSSNTKNIESAQNNEQQSNNIIRKSIGDEIQIKTFKFKVSSVEEKSSINGTFGIKTAKDNAKFIVINMSITNSTNSKYMFWPEKSFMNEEGFVLIDEKSRQYETYDNTIGYFENYLNQRELSPSLTENGYLIYEIPNDSGKIGLLTQNASDGNYYLVVLN